MDLWELEDLVFAWTQKLQQQWNGVDRIGSRWPGFSHLNCCSDAVGKWPGWLIQAQEMTVHAIWYHLDW
jgi:hypothetical protein